MLASIESWLQAPWIDPWGYVFIVVFATLVGRYCLKLVLDRFAKRLAQTVNLYDDALLDAIRKPLGWGIWIGGTLFAASIAFDPEDELHAMIDPTRDAVGIFLIGWFMVRFIKFVESHVTDGGYREDPVDKTTAMAIGKLLRATVMITMVLMVLQALGFSITGVLAFGGIGGIAIGFAARDLIANFLGALMLFWDRPFAVGDWIRSPDREIEGTVEEIGWRLTRIRTFDQRPLYVPNSLFASLSVENPSRMLNRRIYEIIGVRYDDIAVLEPILADMRAMLVEHEAIDTERTLMVNFLSFGDSSLDIMVYTFTKTIVWTEFHAIKEDILLRIARIIEAHGAEIAFPTQTIHLQPDGEGQGVAGSLSGGGRPAPEPEAP